MAPVLETMTVAARRAGAHRPAGSVIDRITATLAAIAKTGAGTIAIVIATAGDRSAGPPSRIGRTSVARGKGVRHLAAAGLRSLTATEGASADSGPVPRRVHDSGGITTEATVPIDSIAARGGEGKGIGTQGPDPGRRPSGDTIIAVARFTAAGLVGRTVPGTTARVVLRNMAGDGEATDREIGSTMAGAPAPPHQTPRGAARGQVRGGKGAAPGSVGQVRSDSGRTASDRLVGRWHGWRIDGRIRAIDAMTLAVPSNRSVARITRGVVREWIDPLTRGAGVRRSGPKAATTGTDPGAGLAKTADPSDVRRGQNGLAPRIGATRPSESFSLRLSASNDGSPHTRAGKSLSTWFAATG